ncbi:replication initiator protein [Fusobacterium naviforme]|nr:replication initiation protein [Fusobacterium naviforme]PSL08713.1 replication initiator protein [Fusobacterium naviforme]
METKSIKKNYLVKKRNVLNELRANSMTVQQLRFFSIYLSKINPDDPESRKVRFPIADFRAIMDLGRINIEYMKNVTNGLLSKVVNVPNERGGYSGFQLFKKCKVDTDEYGEWYVEIDAHDEALPLMFEFKNRYFTYRLWNALQLKSSNQIRMYEILKQYEKIGYRILSIEELRILIGIKKGEYERYNNFKQWVIIPCQQALEENTDIRFTYEPYGAKGPGGKVLSLKFTIEKNTKHKDPLLLDEFIDQKKLDEASSEENILDTDQITIEEWQNDEARQDIISFLQEACSPGGTDKSEFTRAEMKEILTVLVDVPDSMLPTNVPIDSIEFRRYHYLTEKYARMNRMSEKNPVKNRVAYLVAMIKADCGR